MIEFFTSAYQNASVLDISIEIIVFVFGILSVYFARKENILVYPTGLVATILTVYLLYKAKYMADMAINFYYSVMSIYGWYMWSKKGQDKKSIVISRTSVNQKIIGVLLFTLTIIVTFTVYKIFGVALNSENYIDIFTSGIFFTAMWYMALKKIENWTLWILGDIIVIPLYAYRGLGILSAQYLIFTILAIMGYLEWKRQLDNKKHQS